MVLGMTARWVVLRRRGLCKFWMPRFGIWCIQRFKIYYSSKNLTNFLVVIIIRSFEHLVVVVQVWKCSKFVFRVLVWLLMMQLGAACWKVQNSDGWIFFVCEGVQISVLSVGKLRNLCLFFQILGCCRLHGMNNPPVVELHAFPTMINF